MKKKLNLICTNAAAIQQILNTILQTVPSIQQDYYLEIFNRIYFSFVTTA